MNKKMFSPEHEVAADLTQSGNSVARADLGHTAQVKERKKEQSGVCFRHVHQSCVGIRCALIRAPYWEGFSQGYAC